MKGTSTHHITTRATMLPQQTTTTEKLTMRKSVTFSPRVRAKGICHINNFTDQEVAATWYSQEETNESRREAEIIIHLMDRGLPIDEQKYCTRGLEGHTRIGSEQRLAQYYAVRDTVLDEQEWQISEGILDEDTLAMLSCDLTFRSGLSARATGALDAQLAGHKAVVVSKKRVEAQKKASSHSDLRWSTAATDFAPFQKTPAALVA
jgi:hypothetical protein